MAKVWHFLDSKGRDVFKEWASGLQKRELGKLQAKIDSLRLYGSGLMPQPLSETGEPHIKKLKVRGSVQLRPLLCEIEPDDSEEQWVFLVGAFEINWKYDPPAALEIATERRKELLEDETRKTIHVRFKK